MARTVFLHRPPALVAPSDKGAVQSRAVRPAGETAAGREERRENDGQ